MAKNDNTQISYVQIPGYEFVFNNRTTPKGGAVGLYISEAFTYKARQDLTNLDQSIEHQWVEVKGEKQKLIFSCGLYLPAKFERERKEKVVREI